MDQQQLRVVAAKIVRECAGVRPGENVCHPVGAKTGFETFTAVLENASGPSNVIGELGIGLNRRSASRAATC